MVPRGDRASKTLIVDTRWQTETGAIMISASPAVTTTKPGKRSGADWASRLTWSTTRASTSAPATAVGRRDRAVAEHAARHLGRSSDRYVETYWEKFADKGFYFAGDGAQDSTTTATSGCWPG